MPELRELTHSATYLCNMVLMGGFTKHALHHQCRVVARAIAEAEAAKPGDTLPAPPQPAGTAGEVPEAHA